MPGQPGKKPLFSDEDDQNDNFSSPPPPSSAYSLLDDEDLEAGRPSAWASIMAQLKDLMKKFPSAKDQLKRFKQQIIDDKSTWLELIAKFGIGPLIGIMYAWAMGPVYNGGIGYLSDEFGGEFLYKLTGGGVIGILLVRYIQLSSMPDGVARAAHLLKKGLRYLSENTIDKLRIAFTVLAATLPACVQPTYLITAEMHAIKDLGLKGLNNPFAIYILLFSPFLFVDSLINYTSAGWQVGDQLRSFWDEHLAPRLSRPRLHDQTPELIEQATRKKFDADLDKLIHFLGQADDETIGQLYGDLQQIHEQMAQDSPDLPQDERQAREAAMVVFHLLSLGDQVKQSPSPKSSWYELTANTLNGACVISGSLFRLLIMQLTMETVFGLFTSASTSNILGWVFGTIAFPFQTAFDYQGMDNLFYKFLWQKDPTGHASHPTARKVSKTYVILQALIYTLPLLTFCMQATQQFFGDWWWMLAALPYLASEVASQIGCFEATYDEQVVTACTNVHNTRTRPCLGQPPRPDWQRDFLIRLVGESREGLKKWDRSLILWVQKNLEKCDEKAPLSQ